MMDADLNQQLIADFRTGTPKPNAGQHRNELSA
jgi:hypothetical protein